SGNTSSTLIAMQDRRKPMAKENQTPTSETTQQSPSAGAELRDHRLNPQGVVPKQSQAYVIACLAVLILFSVIFSNKRTRTTAPSAASQIPYATEANQHEIAELKRDLTEQQRKVEQETQLAPGSGAGAPPQSQQPLTAEPPAVVNSEAT